MSLLTVANDACDIIGIERQVAIAAGTGGDARQLYRLARLELSELVRRTSWQVLIKEQTFTVTDAALLQPLAVPTDLLFMVSETLFNRTRDHEVFGPVSPREWQNITTNTAANTTTEVFRVRGNDLYLFPAPTIGDQYNFEYVTRLLALSADLDTEKVTYSNDADVAKLDEELVKLGVVWRWKNIKGLDYAEDFRTYEMQVANSIARDGGKRTISMDGSRPPGVPVVGIPAGNWTP